jgi:hypothetical protein
MFGYKTKKAGRQKEIDTIADLNHRNIQANANCQTAQQLRIINKILKFNTFLRHHSVLYITPHY